jgi:hypothetical protein
MSIELPGWVADAFNLVGLPWPGIDEDQLRAWATAVRAYAVEIDAVSGASYSAVTVLASSNDSSFARTLAASWSSHRRLIADLRGPLAGFAVALDFAADAVVAQKLLVIAAAVALAGEVIATQGEALVTFGLAEAEVPAEVAIARLAVKAALQELEGQLLGMLISKAATEVASAIGGTAGKLVLGGGEVAAEAVTLTADYQAMTTLASALSGHASRVDVVSSTSWRKAGSGTLEEGGPGGGWREVARAVEQAILQVLKQLFVDLGRALWTLIKDTIAFLKKAIATLKHTDSTLAADAEKAAAGAGASGPRIPWTGAGHVTTDSPAAEAAYARIRAATGDVEAISANTGISPAVIARVKQHLFLTEHDVPIPPDGRIAHGYFTAHDGIAVLWDKAQAGPLAPDAQVSFRNLMAHEYVESRLMDSGMPYRSSAPGSWDDGVSWASPEHFGAHDMAPLERNGTLDQWASLGITPPDIALAPDLSNIDDIADAALREAGL